MPPGFIFRDQPSGEVYSAIVSDDILAADDERQRIESVLLQAGIEYPNPVTIEYVPALDEARVTELNQRSLLQWFDI